MGKAVEDASEKLTKIAMSRGCNSRLFQFKLDLDGSFKSLNPREHFRTEAMRLLVQLSEWREDESKACILAVEGGAKFASIIGATRLLVFIGCTHRFPDRQSLEFAKSNTTPDPLKEHVLPVSRPLAQWSIAVDDQFLATSLAIRATMINWFDTSSDLMKLESSFSATIGSPSELRCGLGLQTSPAIRNQRIQGNLARGFDRVSRCYEENSLIDIIDSHCPPIFGMRPSVGHDSRLTKLSSHTTFQRWLGHRGTSILHLHGQSDVSQAASFVYQHLDSPNEDSFSNATILYFNFSRHDKRRSSIGAMALTFLAQIFNRHSTSPSPNIGKFEPPLFDHCWTDRDLVLYLHSVRLELGNSAKLSWVIDRIDQCDESSHWFLSELLAIASDSEQDFKVLITTNNDDYVLRTLSKHPSIDLGTIYDNATSFETNTAGLSLDSTVDHLCRVLFLRCPQLEQHQASIRTLLLDYGFDPPLRESLTEYLSLFGSATTKGRLKREIADLSSPSPRILCEKLLAKVPIERRQWSRRVITWVLQCVRPLTPEELGEALSLYEMVPNSRLDDAMSANISYEIQEVLGALLRIESNEIHVRHIAFRQILTPHANPLVEDSLWYTSGDVIKEHAMVATACVRYLLLPETQHRLLELLEICSNQTSYFMLNNRLDFLSYAIQYWVHHYRLGLPAIKDDEATQDIFECLISGRPLQYWAAAYWYFCKPHLRANNISLHPLPILASLGLEILVDHALEIPEEATRRDQVIYLAIWEAARNGHCAVIEKLLQIYTGDQTQIEEAMKVAACSGEFEIVNCLVNDFTCRDDRGPNLNTKLLVLSRAAWDGQHHLLQGTYEPGFAIHHQEEPNLPSALYCAVVRNQLQVVRFLLSREADQASLLIPQGNNNQTVLHAAAKFGHREVFRALIKNISKKDIDEQDPPILLFAAQFGQRNIVSELIHQGLSIEKASATLYRAALAGYTDICRLLLNAGVDVSGSEYQRPINASVLSGNSEILELLLQYGADIGATTVGPDSMYTPLICAASKGHKDAVRCLIDNGADVNQVTPSNDAAHLWAADLGHSEILRMLLQAGADPNTAFLINSSAGLHMAWSRVDCMKSLLEAGANINAQSRNGTALYLAALKGGTESVRFLLSQGADLELKCESPASPDTGFTPLLAASMSGHTGIVGILLEAGANIGARAPDGTSPLHQAVKAGRELTLKALLEYNSDVTAQDDEGDTPLHLITSQTSVSIVKLLINRGANLEIKGRWHYTPLSKAVLMKNREVTKYLISKQANINVVGGYWGGPQHIAGRLQDLETLKLLVESGGDINLDDPKLATPLEFSFNVNGSPRDTNMEVIRYILDAGATCRSRRKITHLGPLGLACLMAPIDIVKSILKRDVDVEAEDHFGRRPIHLACYQTTEHVRLILQHGADISVRDKLGRTVLHTAVASGRAEIVQLILSKSKESINEPDHDGWTPLLWATRPCGRWNTEPDIEGNVIRFLLENGAKPSIRGRSADGRTWSPLEMAQYHGANRDVIELLASKSDNATTNQFLNENRGGFRQSLPTNEWCDGCLFGICGKYYVRESPHELILCFKCFLREENFGDRTTFEERGKDYESDHEEETEEVQELEYELEEDEETDDSLSAEDDDERFDITGDTIEDEENDRNENSHRDYDEDAGTSSEEDDNGNDDGD